MDAAKNLVTLVLVIIVVFGSTVGLLFLNNDKQFFDTVKKCHAVGGRMIDVDTSVLCAKIEIIKIKE